MTEYKDYQNPASYIRVSDGTKQDPRRQRATIEEGARRLGLPPVKYPYEDSEGLNSRDLAYKRKKFQQLLADVEAGKVDVIYIDDQDRFGTSDEYEYMTYISRLRLAECDLIDVVTGEVLTNDDMGTIIKGVVKAGQSKGEQKTKSHRGLSEKVRMAKEGLYQGGNPPYGFDVVCFGPDGKEKWRSVYYGHFQRVKVWPDGRREEFNGKSNSPKKELTDVMRLLPSCEESRIEWVRKIFEWFTTESISPGAIALRLNELGVPSVFTPLWAKHGIVSLLKNPIYKGRFCWNKIGRGRFEEHINGFYAKVPRVKGRAKQNRKRPVSDFIFTEGEKFDFEPFVTEAGFAEVQRRLEESSSKHPHGRTGKKAPKHAALWLRPFMVCGKCGQPMHGHAGYGGNKMQPSYFCGTYNKYGRVNPTDCGCHRVMHKTLERVVLDYIQQTAPKVAAMMAKPELDPSLLQPIRLAVLDLQDALRGLGCEMQTFAALNADDAEVEDYAAIIDRLKAESDKVIAAKETELEKMLDAYLTLPANLQDRAKAKMEQVQNEITQLKAKVIDLRPLVSKYEDDLAARQAQLTKALECLTTEADARRKADAVGRCISKVVCHFEYTGKALRSKLAKVEIKPVASDAATHTVELASAVTAASTRPAEDFSAEVRSHRDFVAELLAGQYLTPDLARFFDPHGTSRKHARRTLSASQLAANGRKAAAARWAIAARRGAPDSRTPAERAAQARAASMSGSAEDRKARASKGGKATAEKTRGTKRGPLPRRVKD